MKIIIRGKRGAFGKHFFSLTGPEQGREGAPGRQHRLPRRRRPGVPPGEGGQPVQQGAPGPRQGHQGEAGPLQQPAQEAARSSLNENFNDLRF